MCEVIIMSHRNKKELFVPVIDKKTHFQNESHYFSENKAEVLAFLVPQSKAG